MPIAASAPPTSAPVPRHPRESRLSSPADWAPSRSTASMPATTSHIVSAAARRGLRVSVTATAASAVVMPSSTRVRPVRPSTFHVTATKTTAATSRHSAPRASSTAGTEAAGRRRLRGTGASAGAGGRVTAPWADSGRVVAGWVVAGWAVGWVVLWVVCWAPEAVRSASITRSAETIASHSCTARGPVTRSPHTVQVAPGSSGPRQSGQMEVSSSRLIRRCSRARTRSCVRLATQPC